LAAKKRTTDAEPTAEPAGAASPKKATRATTSAKKATSSETPAKKSAVRRKPKVTDEMIRERAYLISISDPDGSELDHWLAAERELVGS
jgi:hypothetical protein